MSKRYIYPQQCGDRKKAKLDVTVSDHNFPLSQAIPSCSGFNQIDTWGDDNDDEILLLASQACEEAYNEQNTSALPDYSFCMNPTTTSTQYEPVPSTSKAPFTFKKPNKSPLSMVSTKLKDRFEKISSPLPGIASNVNNRESINLTDDLIVNDKIYKGQDGDHLYRQLLKLQEDNAKLKSENGKLLEKCVTKEGEASILRTQLKTCQSAVDNIRLEKIKAQEKAQMEWMDKIGVANNQIHDLRTQLDFKNLEIISIKEKCKMLESSKIKLTQVTVGAYDVSASHKQNYNTVERDGSMTQIRRVKTTSSSVQTESKSHFLNLNIPYRPANSNLKRILPLLLEATEEQHSLLEYNLKLRRLDSPVNKCRIFSTFHRLPSTPSTSRRRSCVNMSSVHKEMCCVVGGDRSEGRYVNILNIVMSVLNEVYDELSTISHRLTTSFLKEMDERYIERAATISSVTTDALLRGGCLYKDEQAIGARRTVAVLSVLMDNCDVTVCGDAAKDKLRQLLHNISRICSILDTTSCGILYSGLLLSTTRLLSSIQRHTDISAHILDICKVVISCRALPVVADGTLRLLSALGECALCTGTVGNLRVDSDQGVLLYKKDSCHLQVFLKQIELYMKCIESERAYRQTVDTAGCLIMLYNKCGGEGGKSRCECVAVLLQIIVYGLRMCAALIAAGTDNTDELVSVCRSGVQIVYECALRDVEFGSRLGYNEGHLIEFCEIIKRYENREIYVSMLSEISSMYQVCAEEACVAYSREALTRSFDTFSITD